MQLRHTRKAPHSAVIAGGLLAIAALNAGLIFLLSSVSYEVGSSILVLVIISVVSVPILLRIARRDGDRFLSWVLVAALMLKMVGSLVRYYVAFDIYGGVADAGVYHGIGREVSELFRDGRLSEGLDEIAEFRGEGAQGGVGAISGTRFIPFVTAVIYTITGPTLLGAFFVFSWLAFWGQVMFYRAFGTAVPEGKKRSYAALIFFLPSMIFWPSSVGKEALMVFSLGIAAVGVARLLSTGIRSGILLAVMGAGLSAVVRLHLAGMLAIAAGIAYLVRPASNRLRELAPVVKVVTLLAMVIAAVLLFGRVSYYLELQGIDTSGGPLAILANTTERTAGVETGLGSDFEPVTVQGIEDLPMAAFTVAYRPLVTEAHNLQSVLAALEGTFLLGLSLWRIRWIGTALTMLRKRPYVVFALLFTLLFIVAFSSFANFGLLARQRTQMFPLFFVLLSISPHDRVHEADQSST